MRLHSGPLSPTCVGESLQPPFFPGAPRPHFCSPAELLPSARSHCGADDFICGEAVAELATLMREFGKALEGVGEDSFGCGVSKDGWVGVRVGVFRSCVEVLWYTKINR